MSHHAPCVLLAILIAVLAQAPCRVALASAEQNSEQSAAKLKRLKAEIAQLNAKVNREIASKNRLNAKLETTERQIGALNRNLASLAAREKELDAQKARLDRKVAASRGDAEAAQRELSAALHTAFVLGEQPRVKLALEGEDPAEAARLLVYYGYYSRARAQRIGKLTARIAHYHKLQGDLAATEKDIAATAATQKKALAALEKSRAERRTLVTRLNRDIAGKQARIATLERAAKRLEAVIRSVNRDLAETPSARLSHTDFAHLRGKLPWPVAGKIVDRFGSGRTDAGEMHWEAVRIAAPAGTRVRAIADGRVAYAGWLPYYGLVLMVDHGHGYLVVYGHSEALYKQVGDRVKAGDVIATVGQSGGQTRPLLYFQIRHGNRVLDPAQWCRNGHPPS